MDSSPKKQIQNTFPLTCSAIYQSRLFWCKFLSFGDISCRDVFLLLKIMELHCAQVCMVHLK